MSSSHSIGQSQLLRRSTQRSFGPLQVAATHTQAQAQIMKKEEKMKEHVK